MFLYNNKIGRNRAAENGRDEETAIEKFWWKWATRTPCYKYSLYYTVLLLYNTPFYTIIYKYVNNTRASNIIIDLHRASFYKFAFGYFLQNWNRNAINFIFIVSLCSFFQQSSWHFFYFFAKCHCYRDNCSWSLKKKKIEALIKLLESKFEIAASLIIRYDGLSIRADSVGMTRPEKIANSYRVSCRYLI